MNQKEIINNEEIIIKNQEIKKFKKLIEKIALQNPLMLEAAKRGVIRDVLVEGDRDTKKTSTALDIIIKRYESYPNEKFVFIVLLHNMKSDIHDLFINLGWKIEKNKIYDPQNDNKLIGFILSINTFNREKLKGYRYHNITTCVFEEIVPELTKLPIDLGDKISSIIATLYGEFKLEQWQEYNILNLFLTNNVNKDHPLFYKFGKPDNEIGITYKTIKKIPVAIVSLVSNSKNKELDYLLELGNYGQKAFSRKLVMDDNILIAEQVDLTKYDFFSNIDLFDNEGSIYMNESHFLIFNKTNENQIKFLLGTNEKLKKNKISYKLLRKLNNLNDKGKLKFINWHFKELLNKALIEAGNRI